MARSAPLLALLGGCLPKVAVRGLEDVQLVASNVPIVQPYDIGPPVSTVQCEALPLPPGKPALDLQDVLARLSAGHDALVQVTIHRRIEAWYDNEIAALDPDNVTKERVCYTVSALTADFR